MLTAKVQESDGMESFMRNALKLKSGGDDGAYRRYAFGTGGAAKTVDVLVDDARQGTWALAAGTVHHAAFTVADLDVQAQVKFDIEGLGYTDVSDRKHRTPDEKTSALHSLMRNSYAVFFLKKKNTVY